MLRKHPLALYGVWAVILVALPLPLIGLLNTSLIDSGSNLFLYDLGIVAYVWWLAIVYLSTRPQWLDRLIGLPAMYFVHGMLGVFALVAAGLHQQFAFSMHENIKLTGAWAWYIAIFGIVYASFFLSGWWVDRLPLARHFKQQLQPLFTHERSVWLHRSQFVMIGLIWLHVHVIPRIAILTPFMILFDLMTVAFLGSYVYKKFVVDHQLSLEGRLVGNRRLSETVTELVVCLPEGHHYLAGDFYFLRFKGLGKLIGKEAHPFSVASSPDQAPHQVIFLIQGLGDFTRQVGQVPVGTTVMLEGPFGRFAPIVEAHPDAPLVLYGLGSGIAPLLSMAQTYAPHRRVHVIWSAKNEQERYLDPVFRQMATEYPNLLYHGKAHRYERDSLERMIPEVERQQALFFIVGSAPAVLQLRRTLTSLGIADHHVHDERLTM